MINDTFYKSLIEKLDRENVKLVAVSKTKPDEDIRILYDLGQRIFGENKVQELTSKHEVLPKDIDWHMIGHLQRNKVKYIAPFVSLIHGIDSFKLLNEVNKQAIKNNRVINCLLQIHIAEEETKFGFSTNELFDLLKSDEFKNLENIKIIGLMGMATNTTDKDKVKREFSRLKQIFDEVKQMYFSDEPAFSVLSMGMSGDYNLAIESGSTMVRIGSLLFGSRD